MIRSFGPPYFLAALLTLLLSVLQFASPQIVNLLIDFVQVFSFNNLKIFNKLTQDKEKYPIMFKYDLFFNINR